MADYTYFEEGPYRYLALVSELADGQWEASISFELLASEDQTVVKGIRYIIKEKFPDEQSAMNAAIADGYGRATTGKVDL